MKKKRPFNNEVINLSQVIYFEEDFKSENWLKLKDLFPNILKTTKMRDEFVREIEKMEYNYKKIKAKYFNPIHDISYIDIWNHLKPVYPNMFELARGLLVIPYSSVSVERIFSSLKNIKIPTRSRLTTENLESCLLGYQHFGTEALQITEKMLDDYEALKKENLQILKVLKRSPSQPLPEESKAQEENKSQEIVQANEQINGSGVELIERNAEVIDDAREYMVDEETEKLEDDIIYDKMTLTTNRINSLKRSKTSKLATTRRVKLR